MNPSQIENLFNQYADVTVGAVDDSDETNIEFIDVKCLSLSSFTELMKSLPVCGASTKLSELVELIGKWEKVLPPVFFEIPIDIEGSNIAEDGWLPMEEDCKHLPAGSYEKYLQEYREKNAKVIFKNTFLSWDSCDCGGEYGCSHGSYVTDICVTNGETRHEFMLQDNEDIIIENKLLNKSILIPISSTIGDFHRACKLMGIELELTEYAKSLFLSDLQQLSSIEEDGWVRGLILSDEDLSEKAKSLYVANYRDYSLVNADESFTDGIKLGLWGMNQKIKLEIENFPSPPTHK